MSNTAAPGDERDPDQAWYWTPEWQAGERQAEKEIAAGQVTRFESAEAFLRELAENDGRGERGDAPTRAHQDGAER